MWAGGQCSCPGERESREKKPITEKATAQPAIIPEDAPIVVKTINPPIPPEPKTPTPAEPAPTPAKPVEEKTKGSKKGAPRRGKKVLLRILIIIVALAAVAAIVVFLGIPGVKYLGAKKLLSEGEYARAYAAFRELDSFANSTEMLSETKYLEAKEYRDSGNFEEANNIFETLGGYKDSKSLVHYHDFLFIKHVTPTCTTTGEKVFRCEGCGGERTETLKVTAHQYKSRVVKQATCTAPGEIRYSCTGCDDQYTKELPAKDHSYKLSSSEEATCTKEGKKTYKCSNCGKTFTETINKKAHSYANATCTVAKKCKTCGKTEGSPLGHTDTAVCTRCGVTLSTPASDIFNYLCYILVEHSNETFLGNPSYLYSYGEGGSWRMYYDSDVGEVVLCDQYIHSSGNTYYGFLRVSKSLAPYRFTYSTYSSIYAEDPSAWGVCYIDPKQFSPDVPLSFTTYEGSNQYKDEDIASSTLALILAVLNDILTIDFSDGYSAADLGFSFLK